VLPLLFYIIKQNKLRLTWRNRCLRSRIICTCIKQI